MRAALHRLTVVNDDDVVGTSHGMQSMRDNDDRFVAGQLLERLLDVCLIQPNDKLFLSICYC